MDQRQQIRAMVRGAYDVQKLRIQMGLRIVGNFKAKLGQKPGERETELSGEAKKLLAELRQAHTKISDAMPRDVKPAEFEGDELISTYTELILVDQYIRLEQAERKHFKQLEIVLGEVRIYTEFLRDVNGIGPAMAGVIVSEFDIYKARYVSSLWAYAGLDVGPDGRGRSRRKEHLVERTYIDKEGIEKRRVGITFNPFLKTKLIGVLGSSFLRATRWVACTDAEAAEMPEPLVRGEPSAYERIRADCKYSRFYYEHKHRLESHAKFGVTHDKEKIGDSIVRPKWRHDKAVRIMVKEFLRDLYNVWRALEGLEVAPPYSKAKLQMKHAG